MCSTINPDRTINFKGRTRECSSCTEGKEIHHIEDCAVCKGKKKLPKNGRNYKCLTCEGKGYIRLETPRVIGTCQRCNGTEKVPLTAYDTISEEEKIWIFENLFNFDKPYEKSHSEFNEGYLGIGIVCGVTDYGAYLSMTPEEFKKEVRDNFVIGFNQYVSIINKQDGKLPLEILIRKGKSGWNAYPIYEQSKN
jgi:hypothetical protein